MIKNLIIYCLFVLLISCKSDNSKETQKNNSVEGVIAENGMVVSEHPLATKVGVEILQKGGNAVDASVATFFALAVVYPQAGNLGGGGFAVYRWNNGEIGSLDFREKAPIKSTRKMYQDEKGNIIEGKSLAGHLASGVPGSPDGMIKLHEKFGKLSWKEVIQPAIDLAKSGHQLTENQAKQFNRFKNIFDSLNHHKVYLSQKEDWQTGDTVFFKDLAKTLSLIRDKKRAGFYEGETAELIIKEMQKGNGLITQEDLSKYQAVWREPITADYKNYKMISMPPPSSGGVALGQLLLGIEEYPLKKWGHRSTKTIHFMTELERRVYADRATHLGDPDFANIPIKKLVNQEYMKERKQNIDANSRTPSNVIKEGKVSTIESLETTHFSVVDKEGNAVAITTTINGYFGCKIEVEDAGFFLNNEMDDFSTKVGHPNQFGLVGGEANAIESEKRMLSSMTPTIMEKDGKLFMVLGSPGGSTIITSVFQVILNVIEHEMTMQEAVNAYRFHHQWLPDNILIEPSAQNLDSAVQKELSNMGHILKSTSVLGKVSAVLVRPDGSLEGAGDITRSESTAQGH